MTRTASSLRQIALILACGSFLSGIASAVRADEPGTPAPAAGVPGLARLNIAPLRVELDSKKSATTVFITNTSDRPVAVQSRLFAWSQQGGEDQFAPSGALTISPSIIAIAPGATQIVRLIRIDASSPGEKRFRLAVDQLPDPDMAKSGQAEARIRFTLPVFLDRETATPAQLSWRIASDRIEVTNSGGSTARIVSISATTAGGHPVSVDRNSLRYVQGGSTISWPVAGGCNLGAVTVSAQVDGQTANATATPACG